MGICTPGRESQRSKVPTHQESPLQAEPGRTFRTSEESATARAQKAKERKFTTEITTEQHFPAQKQLAHHCPQQTVQAGYQAQEWVSDPTERTRMGCCEDTLRSLIQLSGGSPETRLGISEWQEVLVAKTLTPHMQTVAECLPVATKSSKTSWSTSCGIGSYCHCQSRGK